MSLSLSLHQPQLFFDLCSAHLSVPNSGLNRWSAFHGDMSQIIGDLFQRPSRLPRSMRKIVPQIMEGKISDQFPLLVVGLPFEGAEPIVNAVFRQTRTSLRSEDV